MISRQSFPSTKTKILPSMLPNCILYSFSGSNSSSCVAAVSLYSGDFSKPTFPCQKASIPVTYAISLWSFSKSHEPFIIIFISWVDGATILTVTSSILFPKKSAFETSIPGQQFGFLPTTQPSSAYHSPHFISNSSSICSCVKVSLSYKTSDSLRKTSIPASCRCPFFIWRHLSALYSNFLRSVLILYLLIIPIILSYNFNIQKVAHRFYILNIVTVYHNDVLPGNFVYILVHIHSRFKQHSRKIGCRFFPAEFCPFR